LDFLIINNYQIQQNQFSLYNTFTPATGFVINDLDWCPNNNSFLLERLYALNFRD
jgi:hypothetical protein